MRFPFDPWLIGSPSFLGLRIHRGRHFLTTGAGKQCNWLAIQKPLKVKKVSTQTRFAYLAK
jgi:hypothetical protein